MSDSAVTDRPNKVEISDAGPSRKKLKIEVPAETVEETLGMSLDTLLVEAELPGFRRGRAPKRLIEKRFGSTIRGQAKDQLVASALGKAIEDNKLRVLGQPTSQTLGAVEVEAGKPLVFEVEVEVLPEFELPSLEGIVVRKPLFEVTDEMVGKELEKLTIQEGSLEEREAPEAGDYLTGHAKLEGGEGKVYFDSDGIVVQAPPADRNGKGMIVGLHVEDFGKQLGLPKAGETRTIKTKGPENHENEELRGKDLTVTYKVSRIDRILPAKTQELCDRYGMENEDALKKAIRERLEARVLVEQQSVMRAQIGRKLIDQVKMDLPQRLTADQARRSLERRRLELMYRGVDPMKIEEQVAEMRAHSMGNAGRELKIFFILDKAAEQLGVRVSDQEVNGRIAQIALERNQRPEQLRQQLIQSNQVQGIAMQIREHKTMDAILAKAKVEEMSIEDFNKAMAAERGDAASLML
jgi:trigger factor